MIMIMISEHLVGMLQKKQGCAKGRLGIEIAVVQTENATSAGTMLLSTLLRYQTE